MMGDLQKHQPPLIQRLKTLGASWTSVLDIKFINTFQLVQANKQVYQIMFFLMKIKQFYSQKNSLVSLVKNFKIHVSMPKAGILFYF